MTQSLDKINILRKISKTFFTVDDLQKSFKLKKTSLKKALARLVKKGLLRRLCRGIYILSGEGIDTQKIASQLYAPYAYISFESALSIYGIINQVPYAVTLATYRTPKIRPFLESEIILRKIKKELFFGYRLEGKILIAEPEKALLDTLYLKSKGLTELPEEELNLKGLSKKVFLRMSKSFPEKVKEEAKRLARYMQR
jgi:predicted transcriptional regulator of viral defense system